MDYAGQLVRRWRGNHVGLRGSGRTSADGRGSQSEEDAEALASPAEQLAPLLDGLGAGGLRAQAAAAGLVAMLQARIIEREMIAKIIARSLFGQAFASLSRRSGGS